MRAAKAKSSGSIPLRLEDFESSGCVVVVANITTRTELPSGEQAVLAEVAPKRASVLLPQGLCSVGHHLLVRVFDRKPPSRGRSPNPAIRQVTERLALTARVARCDATPEGRILVELELLQHSEAEWQGLLDYLSGIQGRISDLVQRVRGRG